MDIIQFYPFLCPPSLLLLLSFLSIVTIVIRYLLGFSSGFPGGYGRLLPPKNCAFDEDFFCSGAKFSIISTFELDGDITIEKIRNLFQERVLHAKIGNPARQRYPEFQQYITTLFGFLIWKNEKNFDITEHIIEIEVNSPLLDMGDLHQSQINRSFHRRKSPWELILIRNVIPMDGSKHESVNKSELKSILCFRMHHIMGDAKSIMKIFVECLGGKPLKTAESKEEEVTFPRRVFIAIIFLPFYIIKELGILIAKAFMHYSHPWNAGLSAKSNCFVKFTKPLDIIDLKLIARENGVTVSAVLIYLIAGAMRELNIKLTENGVIMGYVLDKKGHPNVLANHMSGIIDILPTNEESKSMSFSDRLRLYDSFFKSIKIMERYLPFEKYFEMIGLLPRSRLHRALCTNYYYPIGVTNIAGEREGFSIGGVWCSGYRMSVGAPRGITGTVFTIFSYQDQIRISVTGKQSVVSEEDLRKLVDLIRMQRDAILPCQKIKLR